MGGPGLGVLTCSGGDSGVAADTAGRLGLRLPVLRPETRSELDALLPRAATAANPLDYTALVWGDRDRITGLVRAVGSDAGIDQLLLFYDEPRDLDPSLREGWSAVRDGLGDGVADTPAAAIVASTLPEPLPDSVATDFLARGIPAVAGLRTALACAAALQRPTGDPERLRAIEAAAAGGAADGAGPWLDEATAKALLRARGVPVTAGALVAGADAAVAAAEALGGPVAVKSSGPDLRHKSETGAVVLGVGAEAVRAAYARVATAGGEPVLVEAMAPAGILEALVAARRDAVVPALVVGLGGVWTELLDDVAIVPLPASAERVAVALRSLRGAGRLLGARGRPPVDLAALATLAAAAGDVLLAEPLTLLELNPVIAGPAGAVAVDAVARR